MDLSTFKWPEMKESDFLFPVIKTDKRLLIEAQSRDTTKGEKEFRRLFFKGGKVTYQKDFDGTWKEKAWAYCRCFMGSYEPKHEEKTVICAMIMQECLVIK